MKKGRQSKGKEIRPTFFVFCEGETEEAYVAFLRSEYRVPIEIDTKVAGNRITEKYIANYKQRKSIHEKDITFLMYDCDVPEIVDKLQKIKNVTLLLSNPCFELWYLLHFQNQTAELTKRECEEKLNKYTKQYKKGLLCENIKDKILKNQDKAIERAKSLTGFENPSTNIYVLAEKLLARR